jgi:hypothetical protein
VLPAGCAVLREALDRLQVESYKSLALTAIAGLGERHSTRSVMPVVRQGDRQSGRVMIPRRAR